VTVWINGTLMPDREARISVFDHGLVAGDGVFETIKVTHGTPFALTRHLSRLARSAIGVGLDCPDLGWIRDGAITLASESASPESASSPDVASLRITVTSGTGPLGSRRGAGPATVIIAVDYPPSPAQSSAVVVVPWRRNEHGALAGLKTTSYAENVLALSYARQHDADEALFANTGGNLCEGSGTNIFAVVNDRLITPPLSAGCLAGVTRSLVIEWCGAAEEDLPISALAAADEAFLTGTLRNVQPISRVDSRLLRAARGPVTSQVIETFTLRARECADP
jgi:branched-chain amino acid aminotransferase